MPASTFEYDAVVIGSGPNGLAAGIRLATEGWKILVLEARETVGGGMRTAELTLPGFRHDVCSAIHPLGVESPFFRTLPLEKYGLQWIRPAVAAAHPLGDGTAVAMQQDLNETAADLGVDAENYRKLLAPFMERPAQLFESVLGPPRRPQHPWLMLRFGMRGLASAKALVNQWFRSEATKAMFAGMAAHAIQPLDRRLTGAVGLMFCVSIHANGWPMPRGGSQSLADALTSYLRSMGGEIHTGHSVKNLREVPSTRAILFDLSPRQVLAIANDALPAGYRAALERFRYGPGVFKIDYALSEPVPWIAPSCRRAGTVHVGGSFAEIEASELDAVNGRISDQPFVLAAQQSLFDATRAPAGKHTFWAYCHVPNGSTIDMTERIERQLERFAPGFRDTVLARHAFNSKTLEAYNNNYIGGDIAAGSTSIGQTLMRPVRRWDPYSTPNSRLFLCSASTPPGPGVHGMCGYHAAQSVLRRIRR